MSRARFGEGVWRKDARSRVSPRSPPGPEALADRRRRAREEAFDVSLVRGEPFVELEVRNPRHRTRYRVLFPEPPGREGALCTCTDFARRGLGTCKHVEAAWDWLDGRSGLPNPPGRGPETPAAPIWAEVDERLRRLGREVEDIRELERVGSALFEDRPAPGPAAKGLEKGRGPTSTSPARP
jgi:hypothetical protein